MNSTAKWGIGFLLAAGLAFVHALLLTFGWVLCHSPNVPQVAAWLVVFSGPFPLIPAFLGATGLLLVALGLARDVRRRWAPQPDSAGAGDSNRSNWTTRAAERVARTVAEDG